MRHPRAHRLAPIVLLVAAASFAPHAAAAGGDRFRLDVSAAFQVERFHASAADSLGLAVTRGTVAEMAFDFRVLDAPMPGASKPALHVLGRAGTGRRAFGTQGIAPASALAAPVEESPLIDLGVGVALDVPLELVDPGAGASLVASYEGGLAIASTAGYDFMRSKRVAVGFERTRGFFEGSRVEMGYGRNEAFGLAHAAKRWSPRFFIQGRLVPVSRPVATGAASRSTPAATDQIALMSPVRAFVDLGVDTNGRGGPDGVRVLFGLALDSGAILRSIVGATE